MFDTGQKVSVRGRRPHLPLDSKSQVFGVWVCPAQKFTPECDLEDILKTFLTTPLKAESAPVAYGRHLRRIQKIHEAEGKS